MDKTHLLMNIWLEVKTLIVSKFDVTDMQAVDQNLYRFKFISWRCGEGQNSKIRICRHEESDDSIICVVASSPMRLI